MQELTAKFYKSTYLRKHGNAYALNMSAIDIFAILHKRF